ncbi:hypothetical protein [Streptomyces coelicoflavus]|uniref:hypothetical protein n=1 Tax=Streptomyces coelicoflavus TaxID=285562 RepID=UPI002E25249D
METAVLPCTGSGRTAPLEVWNHAGKEYGPSGTRRLARVEPVRRTVDPARCLTPALTTTARPFVLDLLGQFGLTGSRHLDPAGVLRRGHFTGHSAAVRAWADAIGIPSEP